MARLQARLSVMRLNASRLKDAVLGPPPFVTGVAPASGPIAGGTALTITGANFGPSGSVAVTIGGVAAANPVVTSPTTITVTAPAHAAGLVTVTVTNLTDGQSGSLPNAYTYVGPPTVVSVTPVSGSTAGGTHLAIDGTGFWGAATVAVGGVAATDVDVLDATTITATTPARAAGLVTVTVTNPDGQSGSLANAFTYIAPLKHAIWLKALSHEWIDISAYARIAGVSISQALNEVPDTATLRINHGTGQPLKGQEIKIQDATRILFAGHILSVKKVYEGRPPNRTLSYDCNCIDYTWTFNAKKATARYLNTSATAILQDLVSRFASAHGFSSAGVPGGLPVLDEITFTNETLAQAVSRICERIGRIWWMDYDRILIVRSGAELPVAATITQAAAGTSTNFVLETDLSSVATFIRARGGGAPAMSDCAPGQTSIPVADASWYIGGNNLVECGPQRLTITGIDGTAEGGSTVGLVKAPPAGSITWTPVVSAVFNVPAGTYWVGISNVTDDGETLVGPLTQVVLTAKGEINGTNHVPPTDPRVTGFYIYLSTTNGDQSTMTRWNNQLMSWTPGTSVTEIGSLLPTAFGRPTQPSAGYSNIPIPAGATTIDVLDATPFPASGWAEAPGGQAIRYTGKSENTLTGIPASGIGAITAEMRSGTIRSLPHLVGIPASGTGAIVHPIKAGDTVYIVVERWDNDAMQRFFDLVGGDGVHEEFLTDGRLGFTELAARAAALLAYRKDPLETVTFETRDPAINVGTAVTFNLTSPAIVGTFLVQRVAISELVGKGAIAKPYPRRQVECSSRRYTFEDLVQQIKLLGRIN